MRVQVSASQVIVVSILHTAIKRRTINPHPLPIVVYAESNPVIPLSSVSLYGFRYVLVYEHG